MALNVRYIFPQANESDVNIEPFVIFSEEIDPASISNNTVKISPQVDNPAIYVDPSDPKKVVISPESSMQQDTLYTAMFSNAIRSKTGSTLTNDYSWSFRTAKTSPPPDLTPPVVINVIPLNQTQGVSISCKIMIVFSKRMRTPTINEGTVKLVNDQGQAIPAHVTASSSKRIFILYPINPLNY